MRTYSHLEGQLVGCQNDVVSGAHGFSFCDGGRFFGFYLSDSRFSALTLWIPVGIRVGDKLSKLDNFKYGKPKVADWMKPTDGSVQYVLFYDYLDGLVFLSVKNGIIEGIWYSDPV